MYCKLIFWPTVVIKMSGDYLQVGRVRGVLRGRLVLRAPQGSQQNGVIQDHLALLVSQELLEVLESEVPLDLKEYKDFQVHRYATVLICDTYTLSLLLNFYQCQYNGILFSN